MTGPAQIVQHRTRGGYVGGTDHQQGDDMTTTNRPTAPGRVIVGGGHFWVDCGVCYAASDDTWWAASEDTIAAAADALRAHLRTEHADLFERCGNCLADDPACPVCNGRGYVQTGHHHA